MSRHGPLDDLQKDRSRRLRRSTTVPERLLWGQLRNGRLAGLKFRRQHPVGAFILDFYCHEHRLALELDGESHTDRAQPDATRTARLAEAGIRVLRISNDDVLMNLESVLAAILKTCSKTLG